MTVSAELMLVNKLNDSDRSLFIEWMRHVPHFDKNVISYPLSHMARVTRRGETIALLPVHPVLMLESLASPEKRDSWTLRLSLVALNRLVEERMRATGICESYFLTRIPEFADNDKSQGWTKALFDSEKKTWLMKKQIEPPKCE